MKYLVYFLLIFIASYSCKKKNHLLTGKVDIYLLKSFSITTDPSTTPETTSISNAILDDISLVGNNDIEFYEQSQTLFKLKKNIKPIIQDYSKDKAFAITVNNKPVYYGLFHPLFLSSITFGLATIDPITFTTENSISIQYANFDGNPYLAQLDKRNEPRIIKAMAASGRLR